MSERLKRHGRGIQTMSDPEWVDVIGHPTIPHVQSLRAPPAHVALQSHKENLIGLTNKNAIKQYIQKLQNERERNQAVLSRCVDNLPILISQIAYPEKPILKHPCSIATGAYGTSRESKTKFRVGKDQNYDYWQSNVEQRVKDEQFNDNDRHRSNLIRRECRTSATRSAPKNSLKTLKTENVRLTNEYAYYSGFQGNLDSHANNLKNKLGKKKVTSKKETEQRLFKASGFGSLYDELEFERRYKKVFDFNKHIHFVHSNFVSGHRIFKRSKLPPIGHNPSILPETSDKKDIFPVHSVQRFNYSFEPSCMRAPLTSPGDILLHKSDGVSFRHEQPYIKNFQIAQDDVPICFIPSTVKSSNNSLLEGVNSLPNSVLPADIGFRLTLKSRERDSLDSAIGTLTEETVQHTYGDDISEMSFETTTSTKTTHMEDSKSKQELKKNASEKEQQAEYLSEQNDDNEPFNISVHVEIKPKDLTINGGDDCETEMSRANKLPIFQQSELTENHKENDKGYHPRKIEKTLYPTKMEKIFGFDDKDVNETKIIRPRNIALSTDQFGFITQRIQYSERFVLNESLAEVDESQLESDGNNNNATT